MDKDKLLRVVWLPTSKEGWGVRLCTGFAANRDAVYLRGLDGKEEVIRWDCITGLSVASVTKEQLEYFGEVL